MKKFASAAVLCVALAGATAEAQTLEPQMSAQDIIAATEPEPGHLIVPIMMMLFLLFAAGGGAGAAGPILTPQ